MGPKEPKPSKLKKGSKLPKIVNKLIASKQASKQSNLTCPLGRRAQQVEQAKPPNQTLSHIKFGPCERSKLRERAS